VTTFAAALLLLTLFVLVRRNWRSSEWALSASSR
jgi:hypothetical protein